MAKIQCSCKTIPNTASEYQEKLYGKGIRIATEATEKDGKTPKYKCTICSKITNKKLD